MEAQRRPSRFRNRRLKVGLFVDELNIFYSCKKRFGLGPNYRKIRDLAVDGNDLFRAVIYTVVRGDSTKDGWINNLIQYGYEVRTKQVPPNATAPVRADWDAGLCVGVIEALDNIDIVVLASGDSDFAPLVRYCQSRGKIVRVLSVPFSTSTQVKAICNEHVFLGPTELMRDVKDVAEDALCDAAHLDALCDGANLAPEEIAAEESDEYL